MLCFFRSFCTFCVVKFFSHIGLQIFRTLSIVSNYLCNRCSYLISTLDFQRYDPCMLTQYIDNDENVVITFVESCVRAHLDHISLSQIIISVNYNCVENFFLSECAVLPPVVTFRDFSFQICYVML